MTKVYGFGERRRGFTSLNPRASTSEYLNQCLLGESAPKPWKPPEFRARFKYGSSPPLGDNPHNPRYVILSARAVEALRPLFPKEAQVLPIAIVGGESERRSGVHYNVGLEDCQGIDGIANPYFLLHLSAVYTLQTGGASPGRLRLEADPMSLIRLIAAKAGGSDADEIKTVFASHVPPPVFAFGDMPSVFVTEAFLAGVKKAKLKGFSFNLVSEVGHG